MQVRVYAIAILSFVFSASADGQSPAFTYATYTAGETAMHRWPLGVKFRDMAGGGTVGDFNNDGWQDLFFLGGGLAPDKLFINNRDGLFTDQSAAWGIEGSHLGVGASVGDYNNDGWLDIYVTSLGTADLPARAGFHRLYRNNGNNTFTNVAEAAGVNSTTPVGKSDGMGSTFGDYDHDGDLDLAVAGWSSSSGGNKLFRNNGDGTFADVTASAIPFDMLPVRGFSPRFVDFDGDRWPELLWVSDFLTSKYFINDQDGTFTEATQAAGVGLDGNGMGTTVGDLDGDGRLDWYVTSIYADAPVNAGVPGTGNMLYKNLGGHNFAEISGPAGVNMGYWGWGTVAIDVNHDGWLDLVETNGWPQDLSGNSWRNRPSLLFLNQGSGVFTETAQTCGLIHFGEGRGMVNLDIENDGDQDVVIFCNNEPMALFRNDLQTGGPNRRWLRIFLDTRLDPTLAPNGIGAKVVIQAGGREQFRHVDAGCNYLTVSELSAHFGLSDAVRVDLLRVEWPNGRDTVLTDLPADQTVTVSAMPEDAGRGDLNCDGSVSMGDLAALLGVLLHPEAHFAAHPYCGLNRADMNGDGRINADDIAAFVAALSP